MTLDSDDVTVEMDLTVERGVGYLAAERSRAAAHRRDPGGRDLHACAQGQLPRREHPRRPDDQLRQADHRDRDRRHACRPRRPSRRAAEILVAQFSLFTSGRQAAGRRHRGAPWGTPTLPQNMLDMPIEELDLPMRAYNSLKRNNIVKVGQLLQLQDEDLLRMRNFGKKSLDEMKERLRMRGFLPPDDGSEHARVRRRGRLRPIDGRRGGAEPWPTASTGASSAARPARAWRCTRASSCAVLRYEQIRTTEARAKEVRGQVEKIITLAKEGTLASRRRIIAAAAQRAARDRQADQRDRAQVRGPQLGLHPDRQDRPPCRRRGADRPARARLKSCRTAGRPSRSPERAAPCATRHGSNTTAPTSPASRCNRAGGPSRESWNGARALSAEGRVRVDGGGQDGRRGPRRRAGDRVHLDGRLGAR